MIDSEQIMKAIAAHGRWKTQLKNSLETPQAGVPLPVLTDITQCELGRWFRTLGPERLASPDALKVQSLHAEFHQEASRILSLIGAGDNAGARKSMGFAEKFAQTSAALTNALMEMSEASKANGR